MGLKEIYIACSNPHNMLRDFIRYASLRVGRHYHIGPDVIFDGTNNRAVLSVSGDQVVRFQARQGDIYVQFRDEMDLASIASS